MSKGAIIAAAVVLVVVVGVGTVAFAAPAAVARPIGPTGAPPPAPGNDLAGAAQSLVDGLDSIGSSFPHWGPGSHIGPTNRIVCPSSQPGVKVGLSADDLMKGMIYIRARDHGSDKALRGPGGPCEAVKALYNYSLHRFPWQ